MDFLTSIFVVLIIHGVLFFLDVFFKSCSHYPYIRFLQGTGLDISLFKITWFTTAANRILQKWGSIRSKFLTKWFGIGVLFTIIFLPISIFMIVQSIIKVWASGAGVEMSGAVLEPMVPGINLPLSDLSYYVITLAVCSIVHELGHAVAAVKEDIPICGVGIILLFIAPVAFVRLSTEQLSAVPPRRLLNILCAGIWHNVVLAAISYCFLLMVPLIFYPVYEIGRGISVQGLKENSLIAGERGLSIGDKIVAINDCEVSDTESWRLCLLGAMHQPPPAYCVSSDLVHQMDESVPVKHLEGGGIECCDEKNVGNLCFEALDEDKPLLILQYSCLPARPVITSSSDTCHKPIDCPPGLHCIRPVLSNNTMLLRIQRYQGNINKHVIFLGRPLHVLNTVHVSDYHSIYKLFPSFVPESLTRLAKYFAVFSFGFAVINTIPCFYLDGSHIIYALLLLFLQHNKKWRKLHRGIGFCCNVIGSGLLLLNFVSIMLKSLY